MELAWRKRRASKTAEASKPTSQPVPEPPRTAGLFGDPAPAEPATAEVDKEEGILAEASEDDSSNDDEELDEAA